MSDADLDEKGLPPVMVSTGGFPYNGEHIEHWRERALKAEAAIRAALSQAPAPEGWVSTPEEPTSEMRVAGAHVHDQRPSEAASVYRAMLAARPPLQRKGEP